jgi:hypothetical protein
MESGCLAGIFLPLVSLRGDRRRGSFGADCAASYGAVRADWNLLHGLQDDLPGVAGLNRRRHSRILSRVVLVVAFILVIVAFFPQQEWLAQSNLLRMFSGALHARTAGLDHCRAGFGPAIDRRRIATPAAFRPQLISNFFHRATNE